MIPTSHPGTDIAQTIDVDLDFIETRVYRDELRPKRKQRTTPRRRPGRPDRIVNGWVMYDNAPPRPPRIEVPAEVLATLPTRAALVASVPPNERFHWARPPQVPDRDVVAEPARQPEPSPRDANRLGLVMAVLCYLLFGAVAAHAMI